MTALDRKTLHRYRADPVAFVEECLIDPETDKPYVLVEPERAFLRHAFQLRKDGRLKYSDLVYSAPKKSGKTTLAAIFVIVLIVLFGGRFAEGYCCANDLEQATGRVYELCGRIITASPALRGEAKVTGERITFAATGATIRALASDYASAAGGHPSISVFDELWGYTSERGRRLWDELVPVPSRKISCRLVVSYAGFEDESDLLHEIYQHGLQQKTIGRDLYAGNGQLMFWTHSPLLPTQSTEWLEDMRRSLRPAQFLRMAENRFVTTESSFVDMDAWDHCVDAKATPVVADRNLSVFVGVDASVKHDSTALTAVAWDTGAQRVRLVAHRVFQPSPESPLDYEAAIEDTLHRWRDSFYVVKILYDPYQLIAVMQRLARAGLPVEEFPQTSANLTTIGQNLYDLVQGRNLTVYPDASIRLAVSRAIALETSRGWRITKEKSSHKIDVVVALAMAAYAAVQAQQHTPLVFTPEMVAEVASWPRYRSPDMPEHFGGHGDRFELGKRLEAQLRQFGGPRDYF